MERKYEVFLIYYKEILRFEKTRLQPPNAPQLLTGHEGNDGSLTLSDLGNNNLTGLLLQDDGILLDVLGSLPALLNSLVEVTAEVADESTELVELSHAVEGRGNVLNSVGLCEDTGSGLSVGSTNLGASGVGSRVGSQEELRVSGGGSLEKGSSVGGELGNGLAEAVRVVSPLVNGEVKVVGGDGSGNVGSAGLDSLDGGGSGAVLQDNAEVGETLVESLEGRKEGLLSVQDGGGLRRGGLSVDVEDHVALLHSGEDGVEGGVVDNSSLRVGGQSLGVRLDSGNLSGSGSGADDIGGDLGGEVESHEEGH
jgi:hypothetical protein